MSTAHKNECRGGARQVVKTLSKYAGDFIARWALFASGFYLNKGIDPVLCAAFALVLLQAVVMAVWGML